MPGYCVTIEVLRDGHTWRQDRIIDPEVEGRLSDLLDRLATLHASVSGDGRGWSATVTVDAPDLDAGRERASTAVLRGAEACGLPGGPLVRVEVVREDVRDAELERPMRPDLVGAPEAARLLGVARQRVHQLLREHPDFPEPLYRLPGVGPLWDRPAITTFGGRWERRPGRPRKSA